MSAAIARLMLVWAALLALLAATVGLAYMPLGIFRPVIAYAIGILKSALILWAFMELRRERGLLRLAAAAGFVWTSVLVILVAVDYLTR